MKKEKSLIVGVILSVFVGYWGIDRFYVGHYWLGALKLITGGAFGVWWLIDIVLFATNNVGGVELK